ncbi:Cobalt import ATP-binding protein CbiO 1, partial [human gut metagenome]
GAGKSTFFLNINGVLTPKSGKIIYKGKAITKKNLNELRKNIGIVFQDADNQIIASTVLAEVSFGPMNLKLPKDEVIKRVNEALDYMNI